MYDVNLDNIPEILKSYPHWIVWTTLERDGKPTKVPINPATSTFADTTNPATWTDFDTATSHAQAEQRGLGFVFTHDSGLVGIDLDHCFQNGTLSESAYAILQRVQSYTELSPSGEGLHIIARGTIPKSKRQNGIEIYNHARFFTVTGNHLGGSPVDIEDCSQPLQDLYHELFFSTDADVEHPPRPDHEQLSTGFSGTDDELIARAQRGPGGFAFQKLWSGHWQEDKYSSQSEADLALASLLGWWCGPEAARIDRLFRSSGLMRAKWDEQRGAKTYGQLTVERVVRTLSQWYQHAGDAPQTEQEQVESALLSIIVSNRPMREITEETVYALQLKNDPPTIFSRSGGLARVTSDVEGHPKIEALNEPMLRGAMTRVANYFALVDEKPKKGAAAAPPTYRKLHKFPAKDIAADILSLPEKPFPPLVGIAECPTLRPSGTLSVASGYDPETRMVFLPSAPIDLHVSHQPTQMEAEVALQYLCDELLVDFPFSTPADRANFLGCLLTPVLRPAIDSCVPLCLIDKPTPGSGATLLSDLVAIVATGRTVEKHSAPHGQYAQEEWGKKLTAILLSGPPLVIFDNIGETLVSDRLCIALTSTTWGDRLLSTNISLSLPVRATWIATANNISIAGDLARRCYRVWIDPQMERPWTREHFRHPQLLTWAREHRGAILSALLTIARAWIVAGKPPPTTRLPALGGFEAWVTTVGGMLSYAGAAGFLSNLEDVYQGTDDEDRQWKAFFAAWWETFGGKKVTVRYLASRIIEGQGEKLAGSNPQEVSLYFALPESVGWDENRLDSSRKKLGKALKKHANRIHDHFRLQQGEKDSHANSSTWSLQNLRV